MSKLYIFNHVLQKQLATNGIKLQHHRKATVYKTIIGDQPILAPGHFIWRNTFQVKCVWKFEILGRRLSRTNSQIALTNQRSLFRILAAGRLHL